MRSTINDQLLMRLRSNYWVNIFVIYLRYLIGGAFVLSSMPKIVGQRFTTANGESAPIDSWIHFFETLYRSGIYWEFLGWTQLLAALILMTQRFALLGAALFLPIMLNIFVITVSLHFHGTPYITGLMLLANVFLLLWDYERLSVFFKPYAREDIKIAGGYNYYFRSNLWAYLGLIIFLTSIIYVLLFNRTPLLWIIICILEGLAGLIIISIYLKKRSRS